MTEHREETDAPHRCWTRSAAPEEAERLCFTGWALGVLWWIVSTATSCDHSSSHVCSCVSFSTTTAGCSCSHPHHHHVVTEGREAGLRDGRADGLAAGTVARFREDASEERGSEVVVVDVPELDPPQDAHYRYGYESGYVDAYRAGFQATLDGAAPDSEAR